MGRKFKLGRHPKNGKRSWVLIVGNRTHEHHFLKSYHVYISVSCVYISIQLYSRCFNMHAYTDYKVFLSAFAFSKPVFFLCLNCSNQALVNENPLTVIHNLTSIPSTTAPTSSSASAVSIYTPLEQHFKHTFFYVLSTTFC